MITAADLRECPDTKQRIAERLAELEREAAFWRQVNTSCHTCASYSGRGCKLADGVDPPQEVKVAGCPEWKWDQVPF